MHLSYLGPASCVFDFSYSPGLLSSYTGVGGGWRHLLHHRHCFCCWESSCTFGSPRWWLWHFCLLIWKEIFHFTCLWNVLFQGAWTCGPALGCLVYRFVHLWGPTPTAAKVTCWPPGGTVPVSQVYHQAWSWPRGVGILGLGTAAKSYCSYGSLWWVWSGRPGVGSGISGNKLTW